MAMSTVGCVQYQLSICCTYSSTVVNLKRLYIRSFFQEFGGKIASITQKAFHLSGKNT